MEKTDMGRVSVILGLGLLLIGVSTAFAVPDMMAPQAKVEEVLGNLGIGAKDTLIIYSNLYDHTRLWWILAYYGFPLKQMKLLDGGIDAWKAKGYPVEVIPAPVEKTRFKFQGETEGRTPWLCPWPR